jgi:hypothetical protein
MPTILALASIQKAMEDTGEDRSMSYHEQQFEKRAPGLR